MHVVVKALWGEGDAVFSTVEVRIVDFRAVDNLGAVIEVEDGLDDVVDVQVNSKRQDNFRDVEWSIHDDARGLPNVQAVRARFLHQRICSAATPTLPANDELRER